MQILRSKRATILVGLIIAAAMGAAYLKYKEKAPTAAEAHYRSAVVDSGTITQTVTATGTINPVALINVGSQVSGTVRELNADFNDHVKKGQVLLKLDPTIFNAQVAQSTANVAAQRATLQLAQGTFARNERLVDQNYISSLTLDQSRRELDVAVANVALAEAQLARSRADLDNSVIRSPIEGVVIKRSVDLGQTVVASFNTPNLFQIAQDMTKMQIDTNVSEADVGQLKPGLLAQFIVDAYPDREFKAKMRQFRLASNVVQNVVTYNVVLDVENTEELLKPGMTAQVRLVIGDRPNVLRIPTAALRFRLSDEEQERRAKLRKAADKTGTLTSPDQQSSDDGVAFHSKEEAARLFKVYRLDVNKAAQPVDVRIGLSNFRFTEVVSGLQKGDQIVVRYLNGGGEKSK